MLMETASRLSRSFSSGLVVACSNVTGAIFLCVLLVGISPLSMRQTRAQEKPAPQPKDAPKKLEKFKNSIGMEFVRIPAGKFLMGSPEDEVGHQPGEFQREKTIKTPFYLGIYEVTQEQYKEVMGENPSVDKGQNLPVGAVSWENAMEFCRRLSDLDDETYRLPTETEWEYACRAGTTTPFHYGNKVTYKDANFDPAFPYPNSDDKVSKDDFGAPTVVLQPIGAYQPNAFGLYDMHGNVSEWCLDQLAHRSDLHIIRGGNGNNPGQYGRSAYRFAHNIGWQWSGLRVVKTIEPEFGDIDVPITHGLNQIDRYNTEEMIGKIKEALAKPAASLLPQVVIFPAVDADRRVRMDGVGLSRVANYAAAYTPKRRMAICLPNVRDRLTRAGVYKRHSVIDDESIKISLAAVDAKYYILPQIVEENDKLNLTFAVQNIDDPSKSPDTMQVLETDQLTSIPGIIARGVFEHFGADLSEAEIEHISKPQIRDAKQFAILSDLTWTMLFGTDNRELLHVILRNPRCLPAWELFVFNSNPVEAAIERFEKVSNRVACDRLLICSGVRKTASDDEILAILELAPQFRNDTYFFAALAYMAKNMAEPELVRHILEQWSDAVPGYAGCFNRGTFLNDWAWQARGGGWASEVTEQGWELFHERLSQARQELEQAIEINPLGWEAHANMIKVSMAMSLPQEITDEHFQAAIKLRPRFTQAYFNMFRALQPRWGGNQEELLDFADLCVQTGYWEEGIPDIGLRAVNDLINSPVSGAVWRTAFRQPELWGIIKSYNEGIQALNETQDFDFTLKKKFAQNLFAKYGAYGSHFDDVAETFQQLEKEGPNPAVFWDGFTYAYLRDLVFSKTQSGQTQYVSAMRTALDAGEFDEAERWLKKVKPENDETKELVKRCRLAITTGRQLLKKGSIELSAETMSQLFYGVDSRWSVVGDALVCRLPTSDTSTILLPFGIQNAIVTGTISWAAQPQSVLVHSHTRAQRDNVSLQYIPDKGVGLLRADVSRSNTTFQGDKVSFSMTLGTEEDYFAPTTDVEWTAPVIEHTPSGFGFRVNAAKGNPATVKITAIRIELID